MKQRNEKLQNKTQLPVQFHMAGYGSLQSSIQSNYTGIIPPYFLKKCNKINFINGADTRNRLIWLIPDVKGQMLIPILRVKTFQYQYLTADILRYKENIQKCKFFATFPWTTCGYLRLHWEINNHKESKNNVIYQQISDNTRPISTHNISWPISWLIDWSFSQFFLAAFTQNKTLEGIFKNLEGDSSRLLTFHSRVNEPIDWYSQCSVVRS